MQPSVAKVSIPLPFVNPSPYSMSSIYSSLFLSFLCLFLVTPSFYLHTSSLAIPCLSFSSLCPSIVVLLCLVSCSFSSPLTSPAPRPILPRTNKTQHHHRRRHRPKNILSLISGSRKAGFHPYGRPTSRRCGNRSIGESDFS